MVIIFRSFCIFVRQPLTFIDFCMELLTHFWFKHFLHILNCFHLHFSIWTSPILGSISRSWSWTLLPFAQLFRTFLRRKSWTSANGKMWYRCFLYEFRLAKTVQLINPGVDFSYHYRWANIIEIALSKEKKFAVRHSLKFFASKRCKKVGQTVAQFNFTIQKLTPGLNRKIWGA